MQEQNDSDILTISESVRFLIVIYEFRFGKSANAFSKFLEIIEKPRKRYYNEGGRMEKEVLQWHPAFYAGLQIELKEEKDNLIFENEHQLGTKPKEMDVLIIKKEKDIPVRKNIGRIFRKYNIVEYKSPTDYLSIDDYYMVYAYACFYKSDTATQDSIPISEITITFVCKRYPEKLMKHLRKVWNYEIIKREPGIYLIDKGMNRDIVPVQFIITKELGKEENMWLSSLTDELKDKEEKKRLVEEYQKHRDNKLYESVMDIVVRANQKEFEEDTGMCKALEELMADVIAKREKEAIERGIAQEMRNIVYNMLKKKMSDEDICEIVECDREYVDMVRKSIA